MHNPGTTRYSLDLESLYRAVKRPDISGVPRGIRCGRRGFGCRALALFSSEELETPVSTNVNRRQFERIALNPAYTQVAVRLLDEDHFTLQGHTYDISEGGVQFELDRGIEPGTRIALQITLPEAFRGQYADIGPGRSVFVFGTVVWLEDEDERGPVRMAAVFTSFAREGDRERLLRQLAAKAARRAA